MSEPKPPGAPDSTAYHPSSGEPPPQTVAHGEAVYPDGIEASDDAPTIISKKSPGRNGVGASAESIVSGSLRGRSLAHFELIEPIGVGGMAAVIRARDQQLDRPVALKILPPEMASDPENVRRFHQEARAAAKLDHENIARVFFCGEDQRLHFIAFEFVEGVNLRTLLERRGRLPVHEAVHYMLQIATGLAHAAARGVVHRDIKPSNIIISPNGRAKLVDMGLARNMGPQSDRDLTQSGVTLGTFDYIAPEQAMDPREADVRSDIYSLGCTFYHMLTGQPPVPEGTAAKKLHHHQHVAPVDPRQLNPNIPDDVAAILQRMMAKDPKERYQRAEYLVQHLIQVAQKLGAVADLPDGVLFVDAPLPAPPRKRPLFMAAVGMLLLGVLLILLSLAPARSAILPPRHNPPAADQSVVVKDRKTTPQTDKKLTDPQPEHEGPIVVTSEQGLRNALVAPKPSSHVQLDGSQFDSPLLLTASLTIRGMGKRATLIESMDAQNRAVIRIKPQRITESAAPWGGLVVDGGPVIFKNLDFVITGNLDWQSLIAGVLVKRCAKVTFEQCTFRQSWPNQFSQPTPSAGPRASVAVWRPDANREMAPNLIFEKCYFQRGQEAVYVYGGAVIRPRNCAFGPHLTLFHLRGSNRAITPTLLDLEKVSALVVYGPAFLLDDYASCELNVHRSIFSCPDLKVQTSQPDLIRQTGAGAKLVAFHGVQNCYHNLPALWTRRGAPLVATLTDFRSALEGVKDSYDRSSGALDKEPSPWKSPETLALAESEPRKAFAVNPKVAEVRVSKDSESPPLGIESCVNWDPMPRLDAYRPVVVAQPGLPEPRKSNERVVDPTGNTRDAYKTLGAAVLDAKDDEVVILIKGSGPIPVEKVSLRVNQRVTIRPEGKHRPILVFDNEAVNTQALLTLYNGQLVFEDVQFLLRPTRSESVKSQAVVALLGNGQCVFKKCVFTAEQPRDGGWVPMCLVLLMQDTGAMKMAPPDATGTPGITIEKCFLRGDADLLTVRNSRPFLLEVSGSLVALAGSLACVEPNTAEPMAAAGTTMTAEIRLTGTTTYLQDHLVNLRGKSSKGLVYTQVTAENCLFVAASKRALVHIEGPTNEDQMRRIFGWTGKAGKGSKGNTYAGFESDTILEQLLGEGSPRLRYDQEKWKQFAGETDPEARFATLKFGMSGERAFSQALPEQFRPKNAMPGMTMDYTDCGATLNQLPTPFILDASRSAPATPRTEPPSGELEFGME